MLRATNVTWRYVTCCGVLWRGAVLVMNKVAMRIAGHVRSRVCVSVRASYFIV